jgi:sugar phosphate isomerase/epimerase
MRTTTAAGVATLLTPRGVLGANERINLGLIGCGGRGTQDWQRFLKLPDVNPVAACDVYEPFLKRTTAGTPVTPFRDFRRLLERKDVDAVIVATPDHWHAIVTKMACEAGKDVYCEKPLSLTIREGRVMTDAARRHARIVQTGSQQRSGAHYRKAVKMMQDGAIGAVHKIAASFTRNAMPGFVARELKSGLTGDLDWQMWLGPAPFVPFDPFRCIYHFRWCSPLGCGQGRIRGRRGCEPPPPLRVPQAMDAVTRRRFIETVAAAGALAAVRRPLVAADAAPGFRGTLCFFSKHLPRLDARGLARALKPLGFGGVDLTVRPGGHIEPARVATDLPPFVTSIRDAGLTVPMITTALTTAADPAAAPTLKTAAALGVPYLKPGYYLYKFADARRERDAAGDQFRGLARLAAGSGVRLGFHNHAGYIGGNVWDVAGIIDGLDANTVGYYFDVRHAVVEGGDGGWRTAFNIAASRLFMIALKDFYWEKTASGWRQQNCPMGAGMVNWKAYFALLAKADFHGPVSLHQEYDVPGATDAEREANTLTAAAQDLAFVNKQLADAYGGAGTPR